MLRRSFLLGLAGALVAGVPAMADYTSNIIQQLVKLGYGDIKVSRTWLGRVHIIARRDGGVRDIVINPRTGEILRDLWTAANGTQGTISILDEVPRSGSGAGGTANSSTTSSAAPTRTASASSGGSSGGTAGGSTSGSGSSGGSDGGTSEGGTSGGTSGTSGGTSGGTLRGSLSKRFGSGDRQDSGRVSRSSDQ